MSYHLLTREATCQKPIVRYSERGLVAANYDRPVCLFCGYDEKGIIRLNVYHYLNALKQAGFDIVFISASDTIPEVELKKLSKLCIRIILRENRGYDFYGWKTGMEEYPQYRLHSALLLANDSVLGPFFSIDTIIARMEKDEADIVGMTDSLHFDHHLQSYFLYCKKAVITSQEFTKFFSQIEVLGFKMAIVRKYEVGFSRLFGCRFKLAALYSLDSVLNRIDSVDRPKSWTDATIHLWKPLITELKFPFFKKNLLTKRGVSMEEISEVLVMSKADYAVDMLADQVSHWSNTGVTRTE